jgi:Zn-dependent metalloprotease
MAIARTHIEPVIHSYFLAFSEGADKEWRLVKPNSRWNRRIYDSQNTGKMRHKLVRSEGEPPVTDEVVNRVYDNLGLILDYFYEKFGLNSIDDGGIGIDVNIHYLNKYNNAFWDGEQLTLGDGDGNNFKSFSLSLSTLAIELCKGVIQYSAGFIYKGQSGTLIESFSDIISSAIKQYYGKESAENSDWLTGDDIMGPKYKGKGIRSLKEPDNAKLVINVQPKHMSNLYKGTADKGGVHINSGITNHAFYLVSMQIGTQKAALLWFEALKTMKSNAKFIDLYKALKMVAPDLIAKDAIPHNTLDVLLEAFIQVGILEEDNKKSPIIKK